MKHTLMPLRLSMPLRLLAVVMLLPCLQAGAQAPQPALQRDGAHDFDFLIGDWKAHVKRLPERLVGSTHWIEYDGISRHKKLLDSNARLTLLAAGPHNRVLADIMAAEHGGHVPPPPVR